MKLPGCIFLTEKANSHLNVHVKGAVQSFSREYVTEAELNAQSGTVSQARSGTPRVKRPPT